MQNLVKIVSVYSEVLMRGHTRNIPKICSFKV